MLHDLERRLADVLGTLLPAPAAGAVDVVPGDAQSQLLVSVRHAEPLARDFLSSRSEQVPGAVGSRRITRLRCDVALEVRQLEAQDRGAQLDVFDQVLYLVDAPAFRSGRLLDGGAPDPGFFLHGLSLRSGEPPSTLALDAEGFFWPVGAPGQTGDAIETVRARVTTLPLRLEPALPRLVAGGNTVDLLLRLGVEASTAIRADGVAQQDFGTLILRITDAGGRTGQGAIAGGVAGPDGSRRIAPIDGTVSFQYTTPGQPAVDILHVSFDNGAGAAGQQIGQVLLTVRGG